MKFIIKFFPEITIKSKPVRKQFVKRLRDNLRVLMKAVDAPVVVESGWDNLTVTSSAEDAAARQHIVEILSCTPGIAFFLDVVEFPFIDLHDAYEKTQSLWGERLRGKTFAVRCKRTGQHDFTSHDAEKYIGGGLHQHNATSGVDLHNPDTTVRLEIRGDRLFVINRRYEGLGGFPLGSLDPVLSLISGGFDSTVSSYLTMKRGMRTHFCFFNLGGRDHEVGVKEVALYLWMKYGASSKVMFVSVPFEQVVSEILQQVDDSQMGVILKRMMMRAGEKIAARLKVQALVTGESVAQVSSQTLTNLSVIDEVSNSLILRPLITADKGDIINIARAIGTEEFAAAMPEYCGVISVKPTTRAKLERIQAEEEKFDFAILEQAIASAEVVSIDQLADETRQATSVEVQAEITQRDVIIDVRHPSEEERKPLLIEGRELLKIPFYELHSRFSTLDKHRTYLLYCDKGVMSKLHAAHLLDQGYSNVKVYNPSGR